MVRSVGGRWPPPMGVANSGDRPQARSNSYRAVSNSPHWQRVKKHHSMEYCSRASSSPWPRRALSVQVRWMLSRSKIEYHQPRSSARSRINPSNRRQLSNVTGSCQS